MFKWMNPRNWRGERTGGKVEAPAPWPSPQKRHGINPALLEAMNGMSEGPAAKMPIPERPFVEVKPYTPPSTVATKHHVLAMDATVNYAQMATQFHGNGFPGFPYLMELSQITEYRGMAERISAEMTRKWIKVRSISEEDRGDDIKKIEAEMKRLNVRELFRQVAEMDALMGRAQLFIDLGVVQGDELMHPLLLDKIKVRPGQLRGFKLIEPISTYPHRYNSSNPLDPNFYVPTSWYVNSQQIHASRLLTFVSRPLPNMLKPAYNFSGMSLSQLAQPYVDYWFDTRDSVGNLLKNFSTTVLKTNMQDVLQGGTGTNLLNRLKVYLKMRSNRGIFVIDQATEDFTQINTPLSGLDRLQAQAQEHMAAVAKTPLIVLLGISPTGLNASSEGEIRVFYDYVADQQEKLFRPALETILKLVQFNLFGDVRDDITFDFVSLYAMSDTDKATIRASDGKAAVDYITAGVIAPDEERKRLAHDPSSGYDNLDLNRKIEKPNPLGLMPGGAKEGDDSEKKLERPDKKESAQTKPNTKAK